MSDTQSLKGRNPNRVAMAMLVLSSGLAMAIAGFLLAGSAEQASVAIAARSAGTVAPESPMTAPIQRPSPRGTYSQRSGPEWRHDPREAPGGSELSFEGSGDLRLYLFRSAAAAGHRSVWLGLASTPEFS